MSAAASIEVRVYYEDTDFSGVVYHANYLKFFERGRTEAMRSAGFSHAQLLKAENPIAFVARRVSVEFVKPARIDDLLEVRSTIVEVRGASMNFNQEIYRGADLIASARVQVAAITLDGRPARLPADVRQVLTQ